MVQCVAVGPYPGVLAMTIVFITGLLYGTVIYPTDDLLRSFMTNDGVNLFSNCVSLCVMPFPSKLSIRTSNLKNWA